MSRKRFCFFFILPYPPGYLSNFHPHFTPYFWMVGPPGPSPFAYGLPTSSPPPQHAYFMSRKRNCFFSIFPYPLGYLSNTHPHFTPYFWVVGPLGLSPFCLQFSRFFPTPPHAYFMSRK